MPIVGSTALNNKALNLTGAATVATPSSSYNRMSKKWKLIEALRGGTEVMRNMGTDYLPQEPKESDDAYAVRLRRTFLFNLYWRTITVIAGMAFVKPVVVSNVPSELEYLEYNFDGTGRSITEVAYDMAVDSIHYGKAHLMCDFPVVDTDNTTLKDFKDMNYRPYMNHINPTRLISWATDGTAGGNNLTSIRIVEERVVQSDLNQWADKVVSYVRVIYPDYTDSYVYDPEIGINEYTLEKTTTNSLGYIPITTVYSDKTGFMEAEPALYDLAQLNLRHWQSSSDQNNILHIARVPFLLATGFDEGELTNTEIGMNRMIVSSSTDANIKHVEHSGQAIGAGRNDLKDLEQQMAALGADQLLSKGVSRMTATARKVDQVESMSILQMTLRGIEQAIEQCYITAGAFLGVDATGVSVTIGDDLSIANEPNPTAALILLKQSGLLTEEQLVEEAKRQGILSSYFKLDPTRPSQTISVEESPVVDTGDVEETDDDEQPVDSNELDETE